MKYRVGIFCAALFAWGAGAAHESADHSLLVFTAAGSENVTIREDGEMRIITSSGLPNHDTGSFPNRGNPNAISAQNHSFRMPLNPKKASSVTPDRGYWFGVAMNGVPFEPGTAEFWEGNRDWNYEALSGEINLGIDQHNAHVQPTGAYHYHGIPSPLVTKDWSLVGYAADGFAMYVSRSGAYTSSYVLRKGKRRDDYATAPSGSYDGTFTADYQYTPGAGTLDACNGTTVNGDYVYVLTEEFPHVPRCFVGAPDESFRKGPGGPGGPRGHRPGGRPPPGGPGGHPPPPRF